MSDWRAWILAVGTTLVVTTAVAQPAPDYRIAGSVDETADERVEFADLLATMHGVSMVGSIHRGSEMGHENFRDELDGEPMKAHAEHWLALVGDALEFVRDDGGFAERRERLDGVWAATPKASHRTLALAAYNYHMHHRGGRWADLDLQDDINFRPLPLVTQPGRYAIERYYADGLFHADSDHDSWDRTSLSQGLSAFHAPVYAWVRWQKPEGEGDMGRIPEDRLRTHLGVDREDLVTMARETIATLDDHWDSEAGGYDFGEGTETSLDDLGALLRGHKALYEVLYMFSDEDEDHEQARALFERTADLVDAVAAVRTPAGLPRSVRFRDGSAEAASDTVDLTEQWRYVLELAAGYGFTREREGSAKFLQSHRSDTESAVGEMIDELITATETYAFPDDRMVSALRWNEDDKAVEVTDDAESVQALGLYLAAASNAYRTGERYERAQDWDDAADDVVARSRALYERFVTQSERLKSAGR